MSRRDAARLIERALGQPPVRLAPLTGGSISEVWRADLADGRTVVAKLAGATGATGDLETEAWMLRYLREKSALPVPGVLHAEAAILIITHVGTSGPLDAAAEAHAGELLAALHGITAPAYGLERDTLIGPLSQPNPPTAGWTDFFRDHRLLYMAGEAHRVGRLPGPLLDRIGRLAGRLDDFVDECPAPALVHGDIWGGNVLVRDGRIAAFIDPAVCYADPEIELAFTTLFGTFGRAFFDRYDEIRPIRPGFFEVRRDIWNLWPLLVHARLFGGGYATTVAGILDRLGIQGSARSTGSI